MTKAKKKRKSRSRSPIDKYDDRSSAKTTTSSSEEEMDIPHQPTDNIMEHQQILPTIPTFNSYGILQNLQTASTSTQENTTEESKKQNKDDEKKKSHYRSFHQRKRKLTNNNFYVNYNNNGQIKVFPTTIEASNNLKKDLKENNVEYFSYTLREEKFNRIVIKAAPHLEESSILTCLKTENNNIQEVEGEKSNVHVLPSEIR
ncbi:hypothetical protein WA026_010082 [Henosepilachna vigintioctopunctata]|uniref:Uncharacterized protein n=1 Tax=Henosepilachna vigintioctopunctata TaxID=420089 RepID=A0AAW1UC30_9CUCU